MKISAIRIVRVAMPLVYPFRTAFGNDAVIESVLVQLSAGNRCGWGEAASWRAPAYCPECAATQFLISRDFIAPLLLGQEIVSGRELQERLRIIKGNPFAKAAFDLAWWDLFAKTQNQPLWRVLGGRQPVVDAGADFGIMDSIGELLDVIAGANAQGYKRIKLKYRPGWDLPMIRTVRAAFPHAVIHIDCNSAYSLADLEMFKELDQYGLAMIEQPLAHDDLVDHATLQRQLRTPLCLDESITSVDKARQAIEIGACRWVNIKHGRVGGLTNAVEINRICAEKGVPCWIGGMLESAVGQASAVTLATLDNIQYPSDIFPSSRFYRQDLGTPAMVHSGPSQFTASELPGIGVAPDEKLLRKLSREDVTLG